MFVRYYLGSVALGIMLLSSNLLAQPGGGPGGGGPGGGRIMMGGAMSSSMLLMNEKVREELELVEDQVKALEELQTKSRERMMELFQGMRDSGGDRQQAFEELRPKMEEITKEIEQDVDEILLPDQRRRLKQLTTQMRVRGRGGVGTGLLDNEELKKELKITTEQEEKMRSEAEKAQEFLREETAKLQKKAMERVLGTLSESQRKQYEEMVGDQFDFGQNAFGFGGPGGGRGGRGGRDNGRGGGGD